MSGNTLTVDENPATADTYQLPSISLGGVFAGGVPVESAHAARPSLGGAS